MTATILVRILFGTGLLLSLGAGDVRHETPAVRYTEVARVKNNGDLELDYELTLSEPMYAQVKTSSVYPERLLRELRIMDERQEFSNGRMQMDDARRRVTIKGTLLGALQNRDKGWFYTIKDASRYETIDSRPTSVMLFVFTHLDTGMSMSGTTRLDFPAGTRKISFDNRRGEITWEMPPPASSRGLFKAEMDLKVHTEIMNCMNRIRGEPATTKLWIAKAVFRNKGPGTISDFKVRFRLRQYSDWSEWKTRDVIYPTQTVIDVFYPVMDQRLCGLMDKTPILLEAMWSYRRPDGKVINDYDGRILTVLGADQVVLVGPHGPNRVIPALVSYRPDPLETPSEPPAFSPLSPTPSSTGTPTPCPSPIVCPTTEPTPSLVPSPFPYRESKEE